jgi:ArsR family transcriptional regulator, virulence genes transcriptional regulator
MLDTLELRAAEAETLLGLLANRRRLIILCHLLRHGELSVGEIVNRLDLTQSALSQHLALMRSAGIVTTRREGTTIYYSLTDPRAVALIHAVKDVMCADEP